MRKMIATGMLLLFIAFFCFGQKKIDLATAEPFILDLKGEVYMGSGKIPFKEIIVKDYRFDTTKYGYIRLRGTRKIVFDSNSSVAFSSVVNNHFKTQLDSSSDKSLIIVLKTYWLQQGTDDLYGDEKIQERGSIRSADEVPGSHESGACYASLDVFAGVNNMYRALLRLEDEFTGGRFRSGRLKELFFAPFDSVVRRVSSMDVDKVLSTKKNFALPELASNYTSRFDIPVLKSNATSRGVFLTFDDFKHNRVSHPEFVTREGALTDQLYIGKNGDQLLVDYWGFFDGRDYYINIGLNFFKMVRQNNTFDLWGAKGITRSTNMWDYDTRSTLVTQSTRVKLKPLQLDMSLGEVY
jgi:hypothetical protein